MVACGHHSACCPAAAPALAMSVLELLVERAYHNRTASEDCVQLRGRFGGDFSPGGLIWGASVSALVVHVGLCFSTFQTLLLSSRPYRCLQTSLRRLPPDLAAASRPWRGQQALDEVISKLWRVVVSSRRSGKQVLEAAASSGGGSKP